MTAGHPRGRVRGDQVYLGWRQLLAEPDPGAPPAAPARPVPEAVSQAWLAAQYREHRRLVRPARLMIAAGLLVAVAGGVALAAGLVPADPAMAVAAAATSLAVAGGLSALRQGRELRAQLRTETDRVAGFAEVQRRELAARERDYARQYREWRQRAVTFQRQPQWYPVTLPATMHRVDVAGGTLAGWSALATMIAVPRLAAGGEVVVVDLTEGGVAADLLAVARQSGLEPLVRVLPGDLPRLELGTEFTADQLADVLARTVSAADRMGAPSDTAAVPADLGRDAALLARILQLLGSPAGQQPGQPGGCAPVAQVIAALRALGQIGGPAGQFRSGELTAQQLAGLGALTGRGAERLVVDRAYALEARLRVLAPLATDLAGQPGSRLTVAWLDRRAAPSGNDVLAAYLSVALTAALRQSPPRPRWQQTVLLLGADRLPGDILDRLCDATEIAGTGLVLGYRSIPPAVRERLGRGDAAVAFMRLGNADDARLAAEQIGTEHRFVVSQLTDTVGAAITDTAGVSYSGSAGTSDSVADSASASVTAGRSRGTGRNGQGPVAAIASSASRDVSSSAALSDSRSITAGISTGTTWGWSTSRAVGANESLARTAQRTRESLVEQHELQQLPQSALLLCYPAPGGRQVVLADANPAIMTLPTATLASPGAAGRLAG